MPNERPGPGRYDGGHAWEYLLQTWRDLDVPEGWRAEVYGGRITLSPPPDRHRNGIVARVQRALYSLLPPEWEVYRALGVHIAPLGELYVPDVLVAPRELVEDVAADPSDPIDAAEALLIVEVTSRTNADDARTRKLWAYGHAPVPVHLLIDGFDRHGPTSTLFTRPDKGAYRHADRVASGGKRSFPNRSG
ncbi:Uma2 family endonuclease [Streptomyces sp. NPDC127106]|uniref:Uma2 family endonuclease n=1 Tax=Streptomyces sp. NPDC127106 TaxID=3345360 RepID=UPI00363023E2